MTDFDDAAVVRELVPTNIGRMTNQQLKRALTAVLGTERTTEPSNALLLVELRSLREELAEMKGLAQNVERVGDEETRKSQRSSEKTTSHHRGEPAEEGCLTCGKEFEKCSGTAVNCVHQKGHASSYTDAEGQIWLQLSWWPKLKLGVYIPPDDSPDYQASQFGELAARTNETEKVMVMGDLHARLLQKLRKSICHELVDMEGMARELNNLTPPEVNESSDVQAALVAGCNILMDCARRHTAWHADHSRSWDEDQPRWQRLLSKNDCKTIWKAIDWKGKVQDDEVKKPPENEFKEHLE
ncbi:hypothetical protein Pcinc_008293 [Petrolisthes cinctipes]|uniref:Uncharacterized protein n=1 Tax=Petrolisthes cinctipes TaxID=88211 RepID=A0AAE1KWK7_PETCI|nr:hypothetical protein Pcinc_008293 [Petrolisthes cinctipes]